jgi:polysaccharide biosynthesis protein PslG
MAGRLNMIRDRRLCKLTVAGALGLCALATSAPAVDAGHTVSARLANATPLGGMNIAGLGYNSSPEQADRKIAAADALHAKLVRAPIPWSALEPNGPNQINLKALAFIDRLVSDASTRGIKVIMTVDSTPCWASSAPASLLRACSPEHFSEANAWPPSNPSTYATVVGYLASRYGTRLGAIEIWNEPDQANQAYFAGPHKAQRYAAVLRAAYPAIKQANPNVPVLAGSLVGSNGAFLRALYAAGIKGYYDGLSVHFYNLVLGSLRNTHEAQLASGDSKPLWLDEFGWSSCWPRRIQEEQACVTKQVQATNLANTFHSLARTSYLAAEIMYDLQESSTENFGVLTRSGARKPAFTALSEVLSSPFGHPSPTTLRLRKRNGRIIASGSGPVGDYMQLEAFQGSSLRYKALFTLDRFNHFTIKMPRVLGTSGVRVRVYQYWAGFGGAAQRSI